VHVEVEVVEVAAANAVHEAVPPLLTDMDTLPVGDAVALLTVTVDVAV